MAFSCRFHIQELVKLKATGEPDNETQVTQLDGIVGEISGDLWDRIAYTDRLHSEPFLVLRSVGEGLAQRGRASSGTLPCLRDYR
jgi:hypothetical protein